MGGGLGDVIQCLPIVHYYSQKNKNSRLPYIVPNKHRRVVYGTTYAWPSGPEYTTNEDVESWAALHYRTVFSMNTDRIRWTTPSFCTEHYRLAGLRPELYGKLPLVFDNRNYHREGLLIDRVLNEKPLFLYNLTGHSSPLSYADRLEQRLKQRWEKELNLVNTSSLNLGYFFDLIGLMEKAIGMITVDTATLHLAPATDIPYIAFLPQRLGGWGAGRPLRNCVLRIRYEDAERSMLRIDSAIRDMLNTRGPKPAEIDFDI